MAPALTLVGMGLTVASGITGAMGAEQAGADQQQMYMYKQAIALRNAQYAKDQAKRDIYAGETDAMKAARLEIGKGAESQVRNSNLDPTTGSMKAIRDSYIMLAGYEQSMARNNAKLAAWKSEVQAQSDTMQGQLDQMAGQYAVKEADTRATTSLLSAAGGVTSAALSAGARGVPGFGIFGAGATSTDPAASLFAPQHYAGNTTTGGSSGTTGGYGVGYGDYTDQTPKTPQSGTYPW
jgi:hypothetical protein